MLVTFTSFATNGVKNALRTKQAELISHPIRHMEEAVISARELEANVGRSDAVNAFLGHDEAFALFAEVVCNNVHFAAAYIYLIDSTPSSPSVLSSTKRRRAAKSVFKRRPSSGIHDDTVTSPSRPF
jgi:hypothetical protein